MFHILYKFIYILELYKVDITLSALALFIHFSIYNKIGDFLAEFADIFIKLIF